MSSPRLAYGSLHHHGAGLLPDDLEGVDYLLLDGGPVLGPEQPGAAIESAVEKAVGKLIPTLYLDTELKVIVTLGGRLTKRIAASVASLLVQGGSGDLRMTVVRGGGVLDRLEEYLAAGQELRNQETGEPFSRTTQPPRTAWLALDAEPIAAAFDQGARLVLLGHADVETIRLQLLGELRGRSASTSLEMMLEVGLRSRVLVRVSSEGDEAAVPRLKASWLRALEVAGVPLDGAVLEAATSQASDAPDLALVSYTSDTAPNASAGIECLLSLRHPDGGRQIDFETVLGPTCELLYAAWPTIISTDLVEWSVDVRPAKDWVE